MDSIIDWELASKLAGKKEIAEEILGFLTKTLKHDIAQIKIAAEKADQIHVLQYVHKLHGAVAYCGTPRLKNTLAIYERNLRANKLLNSDLEALSYETTLLLNEYDDYQIHKNKA